jgi:uncharacterized protein YbjT (DUF2867 family)
VAVVLVTGASGTLGRLVVARLLAAGHRVRALSHRSDAGVPAGAEVVRGDLVSGESLTTAVAGADVVVHAASNPADPWVTDVDGTGRLRSAIAAQPTPPRIVYVSIVGVDRSDLPYYRAKRAAERRVESSGSAWDILRATQLHTLALTVLRAVTDADRSSRCRRTSRCSRSTPVTSPTGSSPWPCDRPSAAPPCSAGRRC